MDTSDAYPGMDLEVYDYQTGEALEGLPSEDLAAASLDAGDTGAVCAVLDGDVWRYVRADEAGPDARTVYVCDCEGA